MMGENAELVLKFLFFCGLSNGIGAIITPTLALKKADPCSASADFSWHLTGKEDSGINLRNCTVVHGPSVKFLEGVMTHNIYPNMSTSGSFMLHGMNTEEEYSVQIICGSMKSSVITAKINKDDCGAVSDDDPVIEYKDPPSLLSGKDSVLGLVIGLFGFLIILVTIVIVVKRYRRRWRLERIRQYLGSSPIDPFENLQLRMDSTETAAGSERLIESVDSLS